MACYWKKEKKTHMIEIKSLSFLFQNWNSIVLRKKENNLLLEEGEENSLLIESLSSLFQNSNCTQEKRE